jgi:hypothetical protein
MPISAPVSGHSLIDPDVLYSLRQFCMDSGVSYSRMREAARAGVECEFLSVGRRRYIMGSAGIRFIQELARMNSEKNKVAKMADSK